MKTGFACRSYLGKAYSGSNDSYGVNDAIIIKYPYLILHISVYSTDIGSNGKSYVDSDTITLSYSWFSSSYEGFVCYLGNYDNTRFYGT